MVLFHPHVLLFHPHVLLFHHHVVLFHPHVICGTVSPSCPIGPPSCAIVSHPDVLLLFDKMLSTSLDVTSSVRRLSFRTRSSCYRSTRMVLATDLPLNNSETRC